MSHKNHMPLDLSDNTQRDTGETTRSICDDCPGCIEYCRLMPLPVGEEDIYSLLYLMTKEISLLEEELVRWRRALIEKLPDENANVKHFFLWYGNQFFSSTVRRFFRWFGKHFFR